MIYFAQSEKGGPIKIGYTNNNPKTRLASIQTGNHEQLEIVCLIDGSLDKERRIHNTFISIRLQGEWFLDYPQLTYYINWLKDRGYCKLTRTCF